MAQRIALYGGSFNPIHCGHLIIARSIAEQLKLDRVIFLVSATPPHKESGDLLDAKHRVEMVKLAIAGEALFEFSDFELNRPGPNYTFETVAHFRGEFGDDCLLCWIIGADSVSELSTWYHVNELVDACQIVTALRPGFDSIDWDQLRTRLSDKQIANLKSGVVRTPRIEIASTNIRRRAVEGKSIRCLVPDVIREYMAKHRIYT